MVESSSKIMSEIENHRDKLVDDIADLESVVMTATDWRTHYRNHPLWFVGAAFGGGLLLSGIVLKNSSSNGHYRGSDRYPVSSEATGSRMAQPGAVSQVMDELKTRIVDLGVAKAKQVLDEVFPGQNHTRGNG